MTIFETTSSVVDQLERVLPAGVNSPVRALKGAKRPPLVLNSAKGDLLIDHSKQTYIDFCASWGALILGHSDPELVQVIQRAASLGTSYGVTSLSEFEIAARVVHLVPSIDKIRFVSSGTEATMYALRLARGATKRDYIVKFKGNYHGCADFLLTQAGSGFATHEAATLGIPKEAVQYTLNLPYNDLNGLEELFNHPDYKNKIAAVIIEPVAANMGCVPATQEFLKRLREVTQSDGTLLIFDEVVTGFRLGLQGAQGLFGIEPDLTCFGKIIGGGLPAAAFGGKQKYMDLLSPLGPIYQAGTLSGNPLAMAAGAHVLDRVSTPGFYENLEEKTNAFLKPIEEKLEQTRKGCVQKIASMFSIFFKRDKVSNMEESKAQDQEEFWRFFNTLFDQGIYISPSPFESHFMTSAHTKEHLKYAQEKILSFIEQI